MSTYSSLIRYYVGTQYDREAQRIPHSQPALDEFADALRKAAGGVTVYLAIGSSPEYPEGEVTQVFEVLAEPNAIPACDAAALHIKERLNQGSILRTCHIVQSDFL
jgi:hypothetical protein